MKGLKKVAISLFIIANLYFTAYGLVSNLQLRLRLPMDDRVAIVRNLFSFYSVFGVISLYSTEFQAYGFRERSDSLPPEPTDEMVDLKLLENFFPQATRGEVNHRASLFNFGAMHEEQQAAFRKMPHLMKGIYNRKHPDDPVEQVVLYRLDWPHDRRGYNYRRSEGEYRIVVAN